MVSIFSNTVKHISNQKAQTRKVKFGLYYVAPQLLPFHSGQEPFHPEEKMRSLSDTCGLSYVIRRDQL